MPTHTKYRADPLRSNGVALGCLVRDHRHNKDSGYLHWRRSALILGILYLTFQAFPIIFENGHGFNMQSAGLTFLGIGFGMVLAISTQPLWNRYVIYIVITPLDDPSRMIGIFSDSARSSKAPLLRKLASSWGR